MGDVPPPRLAPRGRPTLITDLPTDVLSYIISLVPLERYMGLDGHVLLSVVCRAFADAVRPPSAVWEDVFIVFAAKYEGGAVREQYNTPSQQGAYGTLERAMQVAGPCVRRFSFILDSTEDEDAHLTWDWVERVLATTPRVHYANLGLAVVVEGPPPMVSAGRAAILDFWSNSRRLSPSPGDDMEDDDMDSILALHRHLVAVGRQAGSGAARAVPVLTSMQMDLTRVFSDPDRLDMDEQRLFSFIRSLAADVGQHLTRLHLSAVPGWSPLGVPACVDNLPALRELYMHWAAYRGDDDEPFDLQSVVTPPRGLTCLAVDSALTEGDLLPPSIMAQLEVLGCCVRGYGDVQPPACVRDAGNSFRRLTRLVYGGKIDRWSADLAGWATPAFAVPTLVALEVAHPSFTLGAADGPAWAATVASTTLPRLERLALFQWKPHQTLSGWVYGPVFKGNRRMHADAVAEAITRSLPAAAAAAGRSLSVRVHHWDSSKRVHHWDSSNWGETISKLVNPQVEEYSEDLVLALKYEARPVR